MPFDFSQVAVPFRMQPGLRRVAPGAQQLTPSRADGPHLREKMYVLSGFAGQALLATPGFDASPVLAALACEAAKMEQPPFVCENASAFVAPRLAWAVRDGKAQGRGDAAIGALLASLPREMRATALLCLAFEEDFAIIDGDSATIPWLAVCLPSRWAPEDKVGRHFAAVHAPVADNALLVGASERLALLVTGNDRWERLVWTFSADSRLQQHPARGHDGWPEAGNAALIGEMASFRHEYQSFIPLAGMRRAVFTIRVDSEPLVKVLKSQDDALRLHSALASMTPAVLEYRGLGVVRDRLLVWLARRAELLPASKS